MKNLKEILETTDSYTKQLSEIGILNIYDFLKYFPRTYQEQNKTEDFTKLRQDKINNFFAKVCEKETFLTRNGKKLYKIIIEDKTGILAECVFFAKPFFWSMILEGKEILIIGKAKISYGKIEIVSPKIEFSKKSIHAGEIIPIYPSFGEKLSSDWFRTKIFLAKKYIKDFSENLDENILKEEKLIGKKEAILNIHFPENKNNLEKAKERLAFEELFILQKKSLIKKESLKERNQSDESFIKMNTKLIKDFFQSLSFIPTNAQKIALFECLKDLENKYPMNRLLEGDVGSGKTLVCLALALNVILSGKKQVAFMAPTEVLASQHFINVKKMIEVFEEAFPEYLGKFKVGFLSGAVKGKKREKILEDLGKGGINLLIGTHALIFSNESFKNLGLVLIDEQHKFGVNQRETLTNFGQIHTLNISATPIPRTLALVGYGDLDISVLNEMPAGRKKIETKVIKNLEEREKIYRFLEMEMEKGRQIFVVCPLIEESEKLDVKAVKDEFENLSLIFPKRKIGIIYGKIKADEKKEIMKDFKEKKFDILVSTTVIEVGIDIKNANIMIIEGAERFGLSQLHQLRGRVGRGEEKSYCFLFGSEEEKEFQRLKSMEIYSDGFLLAEVDMNMRGPGEVYGFKQSGIPDLKMANFNDHKMVVRARKAAEKSLGLNVEI